MDKPKWRGRGYGHLCFGVGPRWPNDGRGGRRMCSVMGPRRFVELARKKMNVTSLTIGRR